MKIKNILTKKKIDLLLQQLASTSSDFTTQKFLDLFKNLGLIYATISGISIGLTDLKVSKQRLQFIQVAQNLIKKILTTKNAGLLSELDAYKNTIEIWSNFTEKLKSVLKVEYARFDPANSIHTMAFSGARGSIDQVKQIVGIRGLMADQKGDIVELPVLSNFKKGLSPFDYFISSYGARKGLVDTALKTAESGYLTRRLIYAANQTVISAKDCYTLKGLLINIKNLNSTKFLENKYVFKIEQQNTNATKTFLYTDKVLKNLKNEFSSFILVRSPITCNLNNSICQYCYGYINNKKRSSIGEAAGIISAQSIGEPSTQLTMRTFHTGGIFYNKDIDSHKIKLIKSCYIKSIVTSTFNNNTKALKMIAWQGIEHTLNNFENVDDINIKKNNFYKKDQFILNKPINNQRYLFTDEFKKKDIYSNLSGKILKNFKEFYLKNKSIKNKKRRSKNYIIYSHTLSNKGIITILPCNILEISDEVEYNSFNKGYLANELTMSLKIASPVNGMLALTQTGLTIYNRKKNISLNFKDITNRLAFFYSINLSLKSNCTYVFKNSIIAEIVLKPKHKLNLIAYNTRIKKKFHINSVKILHSTNITNKFCVNFILNKNKLNLKKKYELKYYKTLTYSGDQIRNKKNIYLTNFKKFQSFKKVNTNSVTLLTGNVPYVTNNKFMRPNSIMFSYPLISKQTSDITQGLPLIENLIEMIPSKTRTVPIRLPRIQIPTKYSYFITIEHKILNGKQLNFKDYNYNQNLKIHEERTYPNIKLKHNLFRFIRPIRSIYNIIILNNISHIARFVPYYFNVTSTPVKNRNRKFKREILKFNNIFKNKTLKKTYESKKIFNKNNKKFIYNLNSNTFSSADNLCEKLFSPRSKLKNNLILLTNDKNVLFLKRSKSILTKKSSNANYGDLCYAALNKTNLVNIEHDISKFLRNIKTYYTLKNALQLGTQQTFDKVKLIFVNSLNEIYSSQGINLLNKHLEILANQLFVTCRIVNSGKTTLYPSEFVNINIIRELTSIITKRGNIMFAPIYSPVLLGITKLILNQDGFLAKASFQETSRILAEAALFNSEDWVSGLKDNVILNNNIPFGTNYFSYKNYLDTIYITKKY